ncbi:deoxyribose-phosphate aldolase [Tannockella kyphosi]|uniref:deoxyribose-phosphate aldolase n=1 Tax=Tannockella kyphosi TaxID=2899121 RepID=UPI00201310D9|nr:deoxyribose-phosphate aldolase [Tannockella kyphosi]
MSIKIENEKQLAKFFDHTLLKAFATDDDLRALCKDAKEMGTAMVAINSYPVSVCKEYLKDCDVHVGAAIAFPLGQTTIASKVFEIKQAIEDGADEIDYVMNVGKVKAGQYDYIKEEMTQIVAACKAKNILCKVIFENCYLTKEEIKEVALIAKEVKPDFIKTSTGFGTGGATLEDVALMVKTVDGACQVKAAGGIRDWATCKQMIELGATRIGTSSSREILAGFLADQ